MKTKLKMKFLFSGIEKYWQNKTILNKKDMFWVGHKLIDFQGLEQPVKTPTRLHSCQYLQFVSSVPLTYIFEKVSH